MANKTGYSAAVAPTGLEPAQIFQLGKERTDAMLNMQKELLDEYDAASHAWLARVKSEIDLWSGLTAKLSASHSIPEGLDAYREFVSQRMQMGVEDGQRLLADGQKLISTVTKSFEAQGATTS